MVYFDFNFAFDTFKEKEKKTNGDEEPIKMNLMN
jgi:hypothetical protein